MALSPITPPLQLANSGLSQSLEDVTYRLSPKALQEAYQDFLSDSPESAPIFAGIESPVAVLPSGDLAAGGLDSTLGVWNTRTGECQQTCKGYKNMTALTAFPSGLLASASANKTVRIWDIRTGNCRDTFVPLNHGSARSLAVFPFSELGIAGEDPIIHVWDIHVKKQVRALTGHKKGIHSLALFSSLGKLASVGYDNSLFFWDIRTNKCVQTFHRVKGDRGLVALPSDNNLAVASYDRIDIWDTRIDRRLHTFNQKGPFSFGVLPSGELAAASLDKIQIWNTRRGVHVKTITGNRCYFGSLVVLSSGDLAATKWDRTLHTWSGKKKELPDQEAGVRAIFEKEFARRGLKIQEGENHKKEATPPPPRVKENKNGPARVAVVASPPPSPAILPAIASSSERIEVTPIPPPMKDPLQQQVELLMEQVADLQAKDQEKTQQIARLKQRTEELEEEVRLLSTPLESLD